MVNICSIFRAVATLQKLNFENPDPPHVKIRPWLYSNICEDTNQEVIPYLVPLQSSNLCSIVYLALSFAGGEKLHVFSIRERESGFFYYESK